MTPDEAPPGGTYDNAAGVPARSRPAIRYATAALLGGLLSLIIWFALALPARYGAAFVAGVLLLSVAMALAGKLSDLLLYVLAFNLPFVTVEKTLLISPAITFVTPGIQVGLADLALLGLYAIWFISIFVTRQEPIPRPAGTDAWVLAFLGAHWLSLIASGNPVLTLYEIIRVSKFALVYFYVSRKVERRHLRWIVAGVLCAILIQSALSVLQQRTGMLMGLGRTKGAEDAQYEQYRVPGFESVRRAEGTTFDSHALGLFFAMTLPVPLGLALSQAIPRRYRFTAAGVFLLGLPGLIAGFARAGWLAAGVACALAALCLIQRRQWQTILFGGAIAACGAAAVLAPFGGQIRTRLFEAPPELLTARIETIDMALSIWKERILAGWGANTYMSVLEEKFSIHYGDPYFIPVHSMIVFVLTELGLIGLGAFIGLLIAAAARGIAVARGGDPLLKALAAALLGSLVALFVEGFFDPIYITSVVYYLLWFQLGLIAALFRLAGGQSRKGSPAVTAARA